MKVEVELAMNFAATRVWKLAGGFDLLPAISTGCAGSRLEDGGRLRVLTNRDGSILWERMLHFDDAGMSLSYLITDNKAFVGAYSVGYRGRVTVRPVDDRHCVFCYSGDFEPTPGTSPDQATAAVRAFATDCVNGITRVLSLEPG
jgi:mxaD protein